MRRALGVSLAILLAMVGAIVVVAPSGGTTPAVERRDGQWPPLPIERVVAGAEWTLGAAPRQTTRSRTLRQVDAPEGRSAQQQATRAGSRSDRRIRGHQPGRGRRGRPRMSTAMSDPITTFRQQTLGPLRFGTSRAHRSCRRRIWVCSTRQGSCRGLGRGDPVGSMTSSPTAGSSRSSPSRDANSKRVPPFYECIAITTGPDPTGTYFAYTFLIDDELFPDYPHFGVWPDGYYMSVHLFDANDAFKEMGIIALTRRPCWSEVQLARSSSSRTPTISAYYRLTHRDRPHHP